MALTLQVRIGLRNHDIENNLMQDGALTHIYNPVKQLLAETFELAYLNNSTTIEELENSSSKQIKGIQVDLLENVVHNTEERLLLVEEQNGGHIQQLD
ncbi:hypothetical protein ILUMI_05810 [Ignelater luminosus]|uniref:Uncharacterized protein n=1 Tax=Ignelater luminosus TaxID=2038154 RepID=A0A8K0GG12_IGNLU|nr:hypothetical protein ILUMI_05810 [Ignelater luminosus]